MIFFHSLSHFHIIPLLPHLFLTFLHNHTTLKLPTLAPYSVQIADTLHKSCSTLHPLQDYGNRFFIFHIFFGDKFCCRYQKCRRSEFPKGSKQMSNHPVHDNGPSVIRIHMISSLTTRSMNRGTHLMLNGKSLRPGTFALILFFN